MEVVGTVIGKTVYELIIFISIYLNGNKIYPLFPLSLVSKHCLRESINTNLQKPIMKVPVDN